MDQDFHKRIFTAGTFFNDIEKAKEDKDSIKIINEGKNGFQVTCKEITDIKDKVNGIEQKRTKIDIVI